MSEFIDELQDFFDTLDGPQPVLVGDVAQPGEQLQSPTAVPRSSDQPPMGVTTPVAEPPCPPIPQAGQAAFETSAPPMTQTAAFELPMTRAPVQAVAVTAPMTQAMPAPVQPAFETPAVTAPLMTQAMPVQAASEPPAPPVTRAMPTPPAVAEPPAQTVSSLPPPVVPIPPPPPPSDTNQPLPITAAPAAVSTPDVPAALAVAAPVTAAPAAQSAPAADVVHMIREMREEMREEMTSVKVVLERKMNGLECLLQQVLAQQRVLMQTQSQAPVQQIPVQAQQAPVQAQQTPVQAQPQPQMQVQPHVQQQVPPHAQQMQVHAQQMQAQPQAQQPQPQMRPVASPAQAVRVSSRSPPPPPPASPQSVQGFHVMPRTPSPQPTRKAVAFNMNRNEYKSYYGTVEAEAKGEPLTQEDKDRMMAEELQKIFADEVHGVEEGHGVRHSRKKAKQRPKTQLAADEEYALQLQKEIDSSVLPVAQVEAAAGQQAQASQAPPKRAHQQQGKGTWGGSIKGLFGV